MAILTSQQIAKYFELYSRTEITFNRQVIAATGLVPNNVSLKVVDRQWVCLVYASSMVGARVICGVKASFFEDLRQAGNHASLRYSFKQAEKSDPISFFVPSRVTGYTQYNPKNPDVQLVAIEFTQRPPDDLIQILGRLLEANANAQRRKDERIILTPESIKKLGLDSRGFLVYVENVPRKCIVRDLSFGGAKVLVSGIAKFLVNKKASLKLIRTEGAEEVMVPGVIARVEDVEGRRDIVALALKFEDDPPVSYKLLINSYLTGQRPGSAAGKPQPHGPAHASAAPKERAGSSQSPS